MSESESDISVILCPFCSQELKLVDPCCNPDSFWLPDSYWHHVHEYHPLLCEYVRALIGDYMEGQLGAKNDLRIMLHVGECEDCHLEIFSFLKAKTR